MSHPSRHRQHLPLAVPLTTLMFLLTSFVAGMGPHIVAGDGNDGASADIEGMHQEVVLQGVSSEKVEKEYFDVSSSVVAVGVDVHWTTNYPGAFELSLHDGEGNMLWGHAPEGLEGNASTVLTVKDEHGSWYMSVSRTYCNCPPEAALRYVAVVDTVARPLPVVAIARVERQNVEFERPATDGALSYEYAFGDSTTSGWTDAPKISMIYAEPGTYNIRARVRYADGIESSWGPGTTVSIDDARDDDGTRDAALSPLISVMVLAASYVVAFLAGQTASRKP